MSSGEQQRGVGAQLRGRSVPARTRAHGVQHRLEERSAAQALAHHVCRDGEGLRARDKGHTSVHARLPRHALRHQMRGRRAMKRKVCGEK